MEAKVTQQLRQYFGEVGWQRWGGKGYVRGDRVRERGGGGDLQKVKVCNTEHAWESIAVVGKLPGGKGNKVLVMNGEEGPEVR